MTGPKTDFISTTLRFISAVLIILTGGCSGCQQDEPAAPVEVVKKDQFEKLSVESSGITFRNEIVESPQLNYLTYDYIYRGAGVGAADFNNDGLCDLYFSGNVATDQLYLNQGNLNFKNVTDGALPPEVHGWNTGVSVVDINLDGWMDIYVCTSGQEPDPMKRANKLLINQKNGTFQNQAAEYGLADTSHSTQAYFFDYDLDGDLDLYLVNHPGHEGIKSENHTIQTVRQLIENGKNETDRLYRNDGKKFTDVSLDAGINNYSYGLGATIVDVNNDGYPDIYVANDFDEPDYMYVNDGKNHFRDEAKERTNHVSNFGMGVDAGDINNDGFEDIIVVDMAYKSMVRSKKNMGAMKPEKFRGFIAAGYHHQYMINTLQLNNGNGTYSEIAQLAGVAKSDWSWGPLFEDLDLDGYKDLYITNGTKRDVRNNDARLRIEELHKRTGGNVAYTEVVNLMPLVKVQNSVFRNTGSLQFEEVNDQWGMTDPSTSHGSVIVDLDNDGDLDIVVNREDEASSIYRNNTMERDSVAHLSVRLKGPSKNPAGIGAKIKVSSNRGDQMTKFQAARGYQSSAVWNTVFGIPTDAKELTITAEWPDGKITTGKSAPNSKLVLDYTKSQRGRKTSAPKPLLAETSIQGIDFENEELFYDDFQKEILLPHQYSQLGPGIATGDLNGDGLDDIFITGSRGKACRLYLRDARGIYASSKTDVWSNAAESEDVAAYIFDYNGDSLNDVLVVPGGNEHNLESKWLQPRLYKNQGGGTFTHESLALPVMKTSAKAVAIGDIDNDNDLDLYVAGRITPGFYPFAPRSFLLKNEGGSFIDVTPESLMGPGLITAAHFADMDGDSTLELIVAGEWMPITIFQNSGIDWKDKTSSFGLSKEVGWWYGLSIEDLNGDNRPEIIAGNLGLNAKYHASDEHPLHVYCADFDRSGSYDIILAMQEKSKLLPVRGRECTSQQIPAIKRVFPTYESFAEAPLENIYGDALNTALHYEANELRSCIFWSDSNGYSKKLMPIEAQFSPINSIVVRDVDGDGVKDIIAAGNMHEAEVETVRYDAGRGCVMLTKDDSVSALEPLESGFIARGNVRGMVQTGNQILVLNHDGSIEAFE